MHRLGHLQWARASVKCVQQCARLHALHMEHLLGSPTAMSPPSPLPPMTTPCRRWLLHTVKALPPPPRVPPLQLTCSSISRWWLLHSSRVTAPSEPTLVTSIRAPGQQKLSEGAGLGAWGWEQVGQAEGWHTGPVVQPAKAAMCSQITGAAAAILHSQLDCTTANTAHTPEGATTAQQESTRTTRG